MINDISAIILKAGKERAVKNFHPWIFSGAIKKLPKDISVGDLVIILSHDKEPLALGHFCNNEGLSVRLCSFNPKEIIDNDFWLKRFHRALLLRKRLNFLNIKTTGYRLIHGEGDLLSGLVCDIYGDSASIKLANPGLRQIIPKLVDFLKENLNIKSVCFALEGESPAPILGDESDHEFLENNLSFVAHLCSGQKTGYFLDQRENRLLLKSYAKDRTILDAFCYAGGFSVYALAGGAKSVTSIDASERAIAWTNEHVAKNGPYFGSHQSQVADCFDYLRTLKPEAFDLIVLDPPAFAKSASTVMKASRGYKDINLLALKALAKDGFLFTFSCSQHISADLFKKIIFAAAKDIGREVSILHEMTQGPDHPISVFCPQSSYLKGLVLKVD